MTDLLTTVRLKTLSLLERVEAQLAAVVDVCAERDFSGDTQAASLWKQHEYRETIGGYFAAARDAATVPQLFDLATQAAFLGGELKTTAYLLGLPLAEGID